MRIDASADCILHELGAIARSMVRASVGVLKGPIAPAYRGVESWRKLPLSIGYQDRLQGRSMCRGCPSSRKGGALGL